MPTTATALRFAAPGAAGVLARVAVPDPGAGEVAVAVAACALNHADLLMASGRYQDMPPAPFVPGLEIAGRVIAAGAGVAAPAPGTRVAVYAGHGGLATRVNVPAALCLPLPDAVDDASGAAFQVTYGTAHLALGHRARLRPGERLVVTGAAGGAGLAAVEVGALMGADVVAVARGADRLAVAQAAGAAHLIDAGAPDLRDRVRALGGADVVYDTVGGALWEALFRAANPEARLLPVGFAGGEVPRIKANHLLVKNLAVLGFSLGGYRRFAPEVLTEGLGEVLRWLAEGRLAVHVGARFALSQAPEALAALRERRVTGKIVVVPD